MEVQRAVASMVTGAQVRDGGLAKVVAGGPKEVDR